MTYKEICSESEIIFKHLMENDLAHWWNPFTVSSKRMTWSSNRIEGKFLNERIEPSVETYLDWLKNGEYSVLLRDGALIQITYDLEGKRPVGHRLAYIPCPFKLDWGLFDERIAIGDFIEIHAEVGSPVLMRSGIRFDYDPNSPADHPATHLTFNSVDCRIACAGPLRIGRFFKFVFQNFYALDYKRHSYLSKLPQDDWFPYTITKDDQKLMHLNWTTQVSTLEQ